jgi:hypothetical protein
MNPIKYLKNLFLSLLAFAALGAVACGFILAVALLLRCFVRTWQFGWTLFALVLVLALATPASATLVYCPTIGLGGVPNNRDVIAIPDASRVPLIFSNNLVVLRPVPLTRGVTNNLLPWGYTLIVDGSSTTAHFVVPVATNVLNIVSLITNGVAIGFPISLGGGVATNIDNSSGTNVTIHGGGIYGYISGQNGSTFDQWQFVDDGMNYTIYDYYDRQWFASKSDGRGRVATFDKWLDNDNPLAGVDMYFGAFRFIDDGGSVRGYIDPVNSSVSMGAFDAEFGSLRASNGDVRSSVGYKTYDGLTIVIDGVTGQVAAPGATITGGSITNNGLVWFTARTNGNPSLITAPNGSICTTTNGQFYVRSNSVWLLK